VFTKKSAYLHQLLSLGRNTFKDAVKTYNEQSSTALQGETMFGAPPTMDEIFDHYIAGVVRKEKPEIAAVIDRSPKIESNEVVVDESKAKADARARALINILKLRSGG